MTQIPIERLLHTQYWTYAGYMDFVDNYDKCKYCVNSYEDSQSFEEFYRWNHGGWRLFNLKINDTLTLQYCRKHIETTFNELLSEGKLDLDLPEYAVVDLSTYPPKIRDELLNKVFPENDPYGGNDYDFYFDRDSDADSSSSDESSSDDSSSDEEGDSSSDESTPFSKQQIIDFLIRNSKYDSYDQVIDAMKLELGGAPRPP